MDKQVLTEFYNQHKGEILGAAIGFSIAVIVLILGLLKALFIVLCVVFGFYVGKKLYQDKDYIKNLLDRILPPGTYR
ncbi:Protein of unknown function DUF2273 [Ruminiclostridium papyrosolvens DSM 2782]|uniref:Small integral membrane protein n=1 Tax=Ruminiclostridium papyrosolvens DSM 2782 TaxID=588581 RepID=F1TAN0_9FIRM|nr:DUF2273 domain-containing protein [Ruminiclostridium papyrosolvens]EGD48573.1 Protein of unknown function DUF2273 [Ruminiclostridium papyrosolvens DSM 2782]WES32671.1 DUF2273 domain-containing protein [Ruminiclostridium papyrosolvens DSM 2782]